MGDRRCRRRRVRQSVLSALLGGRRFIDAVAEARQEAYKSEGNTWAAYQCYGDPDWVFRPDPAQAGKRHLPSEREFDNVDR
jgi:hypothetical protein